LSDEISQLNVDQISGQFSYGVNKYWNTEFNLSSSDNDDIRDSYSLKWKNKISLPKLYIESEVLRDSESNVKLGNYLSTSFNAKDSLTLSHNLNNSSNQKNQVLQANYNINFDSVYISTRLNKTLINDDTEIDNISNSINYILGNLNFSHFIQYTNRKLNDINLDEVITGQFGVGGRYGHNLRISAAFPYAKNEKFNFSRTNLTANYFFKDDYSNNHSFTGRLNSIGELNNWQIGYNLSTYMKYFRASINTSYTSDEHWQLKAGISFSFGYDNYNNKFSLSPDTYIGGGSLDIHTYLDRRLNGIYDILDYNLEGVTFKGNDNWVESKTNTNGQVKLFGASSQTSRVTAEYRDGVELVRNDYIIYSHPGSVAKINMPFYLTSEFEGFVVLDVNGQWLPLKNVDLRLTNLTFEEEVSLVTDSDGYYSQTKLKPGRYKLNIEPSYLLEKGFTGDVVGVQFQTLKRGGFFELPVIILTRNEDQPLDEELAVFLPDETNSDNIISGNEQLVHLPPKGNRGFKYSMDTNKNRIVKTNKIRKYYTEQDVINLKSKLADMDAYKTASSNEQVNVKSETNNISFALYVGDYSTLAEATLAIKNKGKQGYIVEGLNDKGSKIYRVKMATFSQRRLAEQEYDKNYQGLSFSIEAVLPELDLSSGYVVQFSAFKNKDDISKELDAFSYVPNLFVARKLVKGVYWYCLISSAFLTQEEARNYMNSQNANGLVVSADNYLDTIWQKRAK